MSSERDKTRRWWQFSLRKMFLVISLIAVAIGVILAIDRNAEDDLKVLLGAICILASLLWLYGIAGLFRGDFTRSEIFPTPCRPDNDPLQYWGQVFASLFAATTLTVLVISTLLFGTK